MREEWAGLLVEKPEEGCNPQERIPRLEELMNKILVNVKKSTADKLETLSTPSTLSTQPSRVDVDALSITSNGSEDGRGGNKKKVSICERLSNLGVYTHSEHFVSFETKAAKEPPHIFSIGETQIMELHDTPNSAGVVS